MKKPVINEQLEMAGTGGGDAVYFSELVYTEHENRQFFYFPLNFLLSFFDMQKMEAPRQKSWQK